MEILNNISPLPFYTRLSAQNHRKDYAYGQVYPLLTPVNSILPFQFIVAGSEFYAGDFSADFNSDFTNNSLNNAKYGVYKVKLRSLEGIFIADITQDMLNTGLSTEFIGAGLLLLKYSSNAPISPLQEGQYYLEIELIGIDQPIYSDVFTATSCAEEQVRVEYRNSRNLALSVGHIDFSNDFKFWCYLQTEIGKPEYSYEEEATSRGGYTFIENQISKKVYKFTALASEYLCDALRIIRLCDTKSIFANSHKYTLTSFAMDVKWEEQGDLASIECEFETDTVICNVGNLK
jgi:hypothetical protein